ncbi:hypothetical protein J4E81_003829 [Alternaria sp. BMP 2799]|nr:hypothetical protein J4E81_003829 [Alternaria sp. BMP 2799]
METRTQSVLTSTGTTPDNQSEFELESSQRWNEQPVNENESLLPPTDGGKDAWLFVAAGFMVEMMVWGFPWSYGIFQEYYSSSPEFAGSSGIPAIGTSAMGILYMIAPLTFGLFTRWPQYRRKAMVAGVFTMCLSLGLSSLCTTVPQLIVTQGIFYGVGGAIVYCPCIILLDEWFVRRKGLAFGIMWAGTALGGVVIPLLLQFLLSRYGFRNTLRIWAGLLFAYADFVLQHVDLPTYTKALGFSSTVSAVPLILLNVAAVIGSVSMGSIIDRTHVTTAILISTIGAMISTFLIWGFSTSLPPLLIFCFTYGLFAGSFANTWPGIMRAVQTSTGQMESSMVFSFLCMGRGIGNIVSGPISEALIKTGTLGEHGLYGTQYGSLVVWTGVSAALGGVSIIGRRVGWL